MKQTKIQSAIETLAQQGVGISTSILIQVILYPIMDIPVTLSQNLIITAVFFIASIIRGYVIRRLFAKL